MKAIKRIVENARVEITVEESYLFGLIKIRTKYSKVYGGGWLKEPNKELVGDRMYLRLEQWNKP